METTNCLVFEKIAFLRFGDRQTDRRTDRQTDGNGTAIAEHFQMSY